MSNRADKAKEVAKEVAAKLTFYVLELWIFAMATFLLFIWASGVTGSMWFGGSITVLAMGSLLLAGIVVIESNPPHKALRTFLTFPFELPKWLAKLFGDNLRYGIHWWFPGLWGIAFDITEQNIDLEPKDVFTQDGVQLEGELSYGVKPKGLFDLLKLGGIKRAINFLDDIFEEILREEAFGTATFRIFLNRRRTIARKMAYVVWERYGKEKFPKRAIITKAGGGSVDEVIDSIASELDGVLTGKLPLKLTLGVELTRLTLGRIGVPPKLLESMIRIAEEGEQFPAEQRELEFVMERAWDIVERSKGDDDEPNLTLKEAIELAQTERPQTAGEPKVKKQVQVLRIEGIDEGTGKALAALAANVAGGS